jgi:hypothetical protein
MNEMIAGRALPCIVCGKQLKNVTEGVANQPSDGVAFVSPGHYGSVAFDPLDGSNLEINVCDRCLRAAAEARRVLFVPSDNKTQPRLWTHE